MSDEKLIYLGDSKASSAERDWLLKSGHRELTEHELRDLLKAAGETYTAFTEHIKPRMTQDRARRVRELRCDFGWSYRVIAGATYLEWGGDAGWEPTTNQVAGVVLCLTAAELLGEDARRYPWENEH